MAPKPRLAVIPFAGLLFAIAACGWAPPAHALRVTTWNLTFYPTLALSTRQPHFRTVMADLQTDVMVVQELSTLAGADSFLTVLKVAQPKPWGRSFIATTESAIYWDSTKVTVSNVQAYNPPSGPRDVLIAVVKPIGYVSNQAQMRVYSMHFKAGTSCSPLPCDSTVRHNECKEVRTQINNVNTGTVGPNFILGGDSNFYSANEHAYIRLTESQLDNDGRMKDPLLMPGNWNNNSGYAVYHTQCPCNTSGCLGGFSGGGMDDRFDLWLSSYSMQDNEGLDLVPGGYITYGNDGQHFNQNIDEGGFNNAVGLTVASALRQSSDHLPVIVTIQVPAKILAASALDFGTVIEGAATGLNLAVSNPAVAPADELTYSFTAPLGFTAPGGSFAQNAGAPAANHSIAMSTASAGVKSGTLLVATDDPDSLSKPVQLSGRVLRHSAASLDSGSVVPADTLAFTSALIEDYILPFEDLPVRVHNAGFDALQARLSLDGAVITGGEDRFSLVETFTPELLSGAGRTYNVHFDDTGITPDSLYEAVLTFQSADEALPGATPNPDLTVVLTAYLNTTGSSAGRDDDGAPAALHFLPPRPNPLSGSTLFSFELPEDSPVALEVYDLGGRRVASLIDGDRPAGRHQLQWQARDASGARVAAGLYFVQLTTHTRRITHRIAVLP